MTARARVRFGIVVFPGSNCEYDTHHALGTFPEAEPYYLWHKDRDLEGRGRGDPAGRLLLR